MKASGLATAAVIISLASSCTVTNSPENLNIDDMVVPYSPSEGELLNGEKASFLVEGEKTFSGKRKIFLINLDLEKIQSHCATRVLGNQVQLDPEHAPDLSMVSAIRNFSYSIKNTGMTGQKALVSFDLDIRIVRDGKPLLEDTVTVSDYSCPEAVYDLGYELFVGSVVTAPNKADKLALSAVVSTSKVICEAYRDRLLSLDLSTARPALP